VRMPALRFHIAAACLALAFCACETADEDSCKETEKTTIEPYFRITWHVTNSPGGPYVGAVEVMSRKHYCDTTVKGTFVFQGATSDGGYYTGPTTQYKLANEKDYVYYQLSAAASVFAHTYYYNEAFMKMKLVDFDLVVQDTIECVLPAPGAAR
jgi:hypothetical protein